MAAKKRKKGIIGCEIGQNGLAPVFYFRYCLGETPVSFLNTLVK
jgi:hypothetical protein